MDQNLPKGQSAIEYLLLLGAAILIAAVVVALIIFVGSGGKQSAQRGSQTVAVAQGNLSKSLGLPGPITDRGGGIFDLKKDFGAKGDGVSDDYESFIAAAAKLSGSTDATLVIPAGDYKIDRYKILAATSDGRLPNGVTDIKFSGCNGLEIVGLGKDASGNYKAKVEVKGDFYRSADRSAVNAAGVTVWSSNSGSVTPFYFDHCNGFSISGLELYGNNDKMSHDPRVREHPSGMGIATYGCKNYSISDIFVHNFQTDGIYLGGSASPVDSGATVDGVVSSSNGRQGLSIIQVKNSTIKNSVFKDTGITGGSDTGYNPRAGVDIEPNVNVPNITENLVFENDEFSNNRGYQIVSSAYVGGIVVRNSRVFSGNQRKLAYFRVNGITIEGSEFKTSAREFAQDWDKSGFGVTLMAGGTALIKNNLIEASSLAYPVKTVGIHRPYVHFFSGSGITFAGNRISTDSSFFYPISGQAYDTAIYLNVGESSNNTFSTGMTGLNHFAVVYGPATKVVSDAFLPRDNFRPQPGYVWTGAGNSYSQN
ncbi:MAG: right-handed parallel beta-helix repeat-containing protein [Candidatus Diapherotrites archaeon]|nr:right-handed parallel beta-helix repeat-containing protein [Candidatus Diapherotrites archaeon]